MQQSDSIMKLSSQYNYFATILESAQMYKEACITLCHSLKYTKFQSDMFCHILLFSSEYFSGKIKRSMAQSSHVSNTVLKIARLYLSSLIVESTQTTIIGEVNDLKDFRKSLIGNLLLTSTDSDCHTFFASMSKEILDSSPQSLVIINELLVAVGTKLPSSEEKISPFLHDLDNSIVILVQHLEKMNKENTAALYIVAASVVNNLASNLGLGTYRNRIEYYIDRAYDTIQSAIKKEINPVRKAFLLTYSASILLLKIRNHGSNMTQSVLDNRYDEVMEVCAAAVETVSKAHTLEWEGTGLDRIMKSLTWTIVTVYQHY